MDYSLHPVHPLGLYDAFLPSLPARYDHLSLIFLFVHCCCLEVEHGTWKAIWRLLKHLVSLSPVFEVFSTQIYTQSILNSFSLTSSLTTSMFVFSLQACIIVNIFSREFLRWMSCGNSRSHNNSWIGYYRLSRTMITGYKKQKLGHPLEKLVSDPLRAVLFSEIPTCTAVVFVVAYIHSQTPMASIPKPADSHCRQTSPYVHSETSVCPLHILFSLGTEFGSNKCCHVSLCFLPPLSLFTLRLF